VVRRVSAAEVRPLRRAVLRPNLPEEASAYPEDDLPTTVHLAAYRPSGGEPVSVATLFPEPYDGRPAWRLRGMATSEQVRGQGYGAAVLAAGLAAAREAGIDLVWCNARLPAENFYRRHDFRRVSEVFEVPPIGPHVVMVRRLDGAGG
jgi:predicted GNAT family N-acyltransferase